MNNYYFTFGQAHCNNDGFPMKDLWIRVIASSYDKARQIFINEFMLTDMPSLDKWSMQYEEKDFRPEYFPGGECLVLQEGDDFQKAMIEARNKQEE